MRLGKVLDYPRSNPLFTGVVAGVFLVVTLLAVALVHQDLGAVKMAALPQAAAESELEAPMVMAPADSAVEAGLLYASYEVPLIIAPGDTLMALLMGAGADRAEAHRAIKAMSEVYSPRKIKPGQDTLVTMRPGLLADGGTIQKLRIVANLTRDVEVRRGQDGGYVAEAIDRPLESRTMLASGTIRSSLYKAAIEGGLSRQVLGDLIHIFSFDVDFQREIQPGDSFELMYESFVDENGTAVRYGDIQVASMTLSGQKQSYYRFKGADGFYDYYDAKGKSVRKTLLKTPIDGARISSRYGKRRHPILGYNKMHRGVDFAARTGTPVFAAGNGIVETAGRNGAYGKYVRIRHSGSYKTAYAHLSGYGPSIRKGRRVKQGQVIGYVGSTGRSTGPHLHYEVHKNGRRVNPLSIKLPSGRHLKGKELAAFEDHRRRLVSQFAALEGSTQIATAVESEQQ